MRPQLFAGEYEQQAQRAEQAATASMRPQLFAGEYRRRTGTEFEHWRRFNEAPAIRWGIQAFAPAKLLSNHLASMRPQLFAGEYTVSMLTLPL